MIFMVAVQIITSNQDFWFTNCFLSKCASQRLVSKQSLSESNASLLSKIRACKHLILADAMTCVRPEKKIFAGYISDEKSNKQLYLLRVIHFDYIVN